MSEEFERTTRIRPATSDDAAEIVTVRLASWRATYHAVPAAAFDAIDVPALVARTAQRISAGNVRTLVAIRDERLVAYADVGRCRDEDVPPDAGEVYSIYAAPEHWSTGVGRELFAAALDELATPVVVLWVLTDNERARRFYEIAGFRPDGQRKPAELLGGVTSPEMRYRRG